MAIGDVVQSGSANILSGHTATIGSTPTVGNTLIVFVGLTNNTNTSSPNGFTAATDYIELADGWQPYSLRAYYREVQSGDTTTISFTQTGTSTKRIQYVELEGVLALDVTDSVARGTSLETDPQEVGTLTPTVGAIALVGCLVERSNVNTPVTFTPDANTTELADVYGSDRVPMWLGYRNINPASGSYTMEVDRDQTTGLPRGHFSILLAFDIEAEDPAPPDPPTESGPGIYIDFEEDGFSDGTVAAGTDDGTLARRLPYDPGTGTGIDDNVTEWVLGSARNITGNRPGSADHITQPSPETYTFYLKNTDGRFTPENTASPYYPLFKPGLPVWGGMNADGTLSGTGQAVYGFMAGYIRSIAPVPERGQPNAPVVEVIVDGPMATWRRRRARVEFAEGRSYAEYREAILASIGETRIDLGQESDILTFSGNATNKKSRVSPILGSRNQPFDQQALSPDFRLPETRTDPVALLEALNLATGARHFIQPANSKEDWFAYTTVPRFHKMGSASDGTFDDGDIVEIAGYELSDDSLLNVQEVSFSQVSSTVTPVIVWQYGDVPKSVTSAKNEVIVAEVGDWVVDATLDVAYSGSLVTSSLTNYGSTLLIILGSSGTSQVTSLTVSGRRIRRDSAQSIEARASGVTPAKERLAPTINTDYLQSEPLAVGRAEFTPYKFSRHLSRPTAKYIRDFSTVLPRQLYDVIDLTVDQIDVSAKRHEITGISFTCSVAASAEVSDWAFTFDLQATPNSSPLDLWTWDTSTWDGGDVWAP